MVLVLLLGALALYYSVHVSHERTLKANFEAQKNYANVVKTRFQGSLRNLDVLLNDVVYDYQHSPSSALHERLDKQIRLFPEVDLLLVSDADGEVRFVSGNLPEPTVQQLKPRNIRQYDYFQFHQQAQTQEFHHLHISRPIKMPGDHYGITVSRALRDAQGRLQGIAVASLTSSFFEQVLRVAMPPEHAQTTRLALLNVAGDILHVLPNDVHQGINVAHQEIFQTFLSSGAPLDQHIHNSEMDGQPRLVTLLRLEPTPLIVGVGQFENAILNHWHQETLIKLSSYISFALLALVLTWSLQHRRAERDRAYQTIKDNEQRLQLIMQASHDGHWDMDIVHQQIAFSERWWEMLGYVSGDLPATLDVWYQLIHPDEREPQSKRFEAAVASNQLLYETEFRLHHRDGHWVPVLSRAMIIRNEDHQAVRLIGVNTDLTELKRSQQQLRYETQRYRAVFERSMVGITTNTVDHRWIDINQALCDILGYSHDEIQQKKWSELTHPDDLTEEQPLYAKLLTGEITEYARDKRFIRPDGRIIWTRLAVRGVYDAQGRMEYAIALIEDIDEQKRTHLALERSETRMRRAEQLTKSGNWEIHLDSFLISSSPGAAAIYGISTDPISLRDIQGFTLQEYRSYMDQAMRDLLERGLPYDVEYRIRRHDGELRHMHSMATLDREQGIVFGAIQDITERKQAEAQIVQLSNFDSLTQLPNRRSLYSRLSQLLAACQRKQKLGAVLFMDLDGFQLFNDTRGHDAGDQLLREVAQRLKNCTRTDDFLARLGGDEFAILLDNLPQSLADASTQTENLAQKILREVDQMMQFDGFEHHISTSIGACLFSGVAGESSEEIFKRTDAALHRAKNSGRNTLCFFDPELQTHLEVRAQTEAELRKALPLNQLELHFQPQVDAQGRINGTEALLRWQHPQWGMVSPARFITIAEESGLILPIGRWVITSACQYLERWMHEPGHENFRLSVNVSARQFRQPDFAQQVQDIVAQTGVDPQHLTLEITESLLLDNINDTIEKMHRLNALGVGFSIDDFGTGYSSLSYLKRLPLDELKIDQSFVRDIATDPSDKVIVRTIIAMAHSLDLKVVAEGVETEEQRDFLSEHGCPLFQGYYFSRPQPAADFERLLLDSQT